MSSAPPIDIAAAKGFAAFLITHNIRLSALEFHQDMLERDVDLPELREFLETDSQLPVPTAPVNSEIEHLKKKVKQLQLENESLTKQATVAASPKKEIEKEFLLLSEQLRAQSQTTDDILQILAERLPTVLTNVRSSRKDSLIDILVTVIQYHPAQQVRSSLIFHFITLFKRPDAEQRSLMLDGISSLVERVKSYPNRVDKELLTTVRSLLEYRYPEQRVLAVQIMNLLHEHLPPNVQHEVSLLLGSVIELDTSSAVRESAVVALAGSLCGVKNPTEALLSSSIKVFIKTLTDSNQKVQKSGVQKLLPILIEQTLTEGERSVHLLIQEVVATVLDPDGEFVLKLSALQKCLGALRTVLQGSVPSCIGTYPGETLSVLLRKAIQRQIKGIWIPAEQLFDTTVRQVLKVITQTRDAQQKSAVDFLIACCHLTDQPVLDDAVSPLFLEIILRGYQALGSPETDTKPRWGLLPSYMRYFAGVHNDQGKCSEQLTALLNDAVLHYCEDLENISDLTLVLCAAAEEYPIVKDILLSLVWNSISPSCDDVVRVAAAKVFEIALSQHIFSSKLVLRKALPPALTLLTDNSKDVRVLAATCAAHITSQVQCDDAITKIGNTLLQKNATAFDGDISSYRTWLKEILPALIKGQKLQSTAATLIQEAIDFISDLLQKEEASEELPNLSSTITVLCDFAKGLLSPAPALLSSFRTLQKCIPDHSPLCNLLNSIIRDREAIDEGSAPKKAFLAKFRELLPNGDEKEKQQRDLSPKADSVEGSTSTNGNKHSLLSKMQHRFFGGNSEGQIRGHPKDSNSPEG